LLWWQSSTITLKTDKVNFMSQNNAKTQTAKSFIKPKPPKVVLNPLTDAELEQLDATLDQLLASISENESESRLPLSLDAVDGFFAALALSPKSTAIGEWMPMVMGDAQFASKEQTQAVRNLLIRHYNSVVHSLRRADIEDFQPLVSYNDDDHPVVAAWCSGFVLGFERQEEAWGKQMDDGAWAEMHVLYALKDSDELGELFLVEEADEGEYELFERRVELVELMRAEVSELLEEPADNLALIHFALTGLQATMLSQKSSLKSSSSSRQVH
jgi:yecA family protein